MRKLPVAVALQITIEKVLSGEINEAIENIGKTGASYVEFRLDYEKDVETLSLKDLVSLARKNGLKSILTCRISLEGGNFDQNDRERHEKILRDMISSGPDFIDIELSNDKSLVNDVLERCVANDTRLILSLHYFDSTPALEEFESYLEDYESFLSKLPPLTDKVRASLVLKIIFKANSLSDNLIPFKLVSALGKRIRCDVVSFCMGSEGITSRIYSVVPRGTPPRSGLFTFASYGKKTAPGQVHLNDLIANLKPFFDESN